MTANLTYLKAVFILPTEWWFFTTPAVFISLVLEIPVRENYKLKLEA